jgi:diaminopimelate epimerase
MRFAKLHGIGNDYVFVDGTRRRVANPEKLARSVSDRRFGVGSDGLIVVGRSKAADFRMRMYNPDGSEAEMCGNGLRCLGKFVFDRKMTRRRRITVETAAGVKALELHARGGRVDRVSVDMGEPLPVPPRFHRLADGRSRMVPVAIEANGQRFDAHVLSMGNPHCVVFVEDARGFPVDVIGPLIERHADFPSRTNIEFVSWVDARTLFQRTWERGAGETWACGSGACAVAASLFMSGRAEGRLTIRLLGGELDLEMREGRIVMTGPAAEVFEGELSQTR